MRKCNAVRRARRCVLRRLNIIRYQRYLNAIWRQAAALARLRGSEYPSSLADIHPGLQPSKPKKR